MEEVWVVDRARLRELMQQQPSLTQRELAQQMGRSLGWVKKWSKRLQLTSSDDEQVLPAHAAVPARGARRR